MKKIYYEKDNVVKIERYNKNRVLTDDLTYRVIQDSHLKTRKLDKGNLLLEKSGGGDLQPVGKVVLFDHDFVAVTSNFIARMPVVEGYEPAFLTYLHNTLYAGRINTKSIKQTTGIQNLDSSQYLSELVGIPPLEEQQAIAKFLDRETAKLDDLIATKRTFIERLKEKH